MRAATFVLLPFVLLWLHAGPAAAARDRYITALAPVDSLYAHGRNTDAAARIDSLRAAAAARHDEGLQAAVLARRAGASAYFRRYDAAGADADSAIVLARARRDTLTWCRALLVKGRVALYQERFAEAGPPYRQLLRLGTAIGDRVMLGYARLGLAYLDLNAQRVGRAARGYRAAIRMLEGGAEIQGELTARVGLARAVRALGRPREAQAIYRVLIARCLALGEQQNQASAWNNLGAIEEDIGDPGRAGTYFQRALECNRRMGRPTDGQVLNLSILLTRRGQFELAREELERELAKPPLPGGADTRHQLRTQLAIVLGYESRNNEAERLLRELWAVRDSVSADAAVGAGLALGECLFNSHRPAEAEQVLRAAQALNHGVPGRPRAVIMRTKIARAVLALGRTQQALFEALEAWREAAPDLDSQGTRLAAGLALEECYVSAGLGDSARALSPSLATELDRFRESSADAQWSASLGASAARLARFTAASFLDTTRAEPAGLRAGQAFDALQRLKARSLFSRQRRLATASEMRTTVLRGREVFLDLYSSYSDSSLVLIALSPGLTPVASIAVPHDPGPEIRAWQACSSRAPVAAENRRAQANAVLRSVLGPSLDLVLAARRVYFSPSSYSVVLPLGAMLEDLRPGSAPEVVIVPSASWLAESRSRRRTVPAPVRVIAIGRTTDAAGRPLPGVRDELGWLRSRYGAEAFVNPGNRDLDEVRPLLARGSILHIAAHSRAEMRDLWNSALLLGKGADESAWLTFSDIARDSACAPLVVLASCNTTVGSNLGNESVYGIASAFLAAGARTTISTLWDADDRATAGFTRAFYAALERGATALVALRSAQRAVASEPATRDPYYWAGFVLIGEPDLVVRPVPRGALPGPGSGKRDRP